MDMKYQIEKSEDAEIVFLSGEINEEAEVSLPELLGKLTTNVRFNFRGITSINSCGVRAWVNFLREAEQKATIVFEECTPDVVSQINMIPNFKSNATIHSVYAAYSCEKCGHQQQELLEAGKSLPTSLDEDLPQYKCKKCDSITEMEDLEEEFFAWLDS